jgi:putative flippase GtrA
VALSQNRHVASVQTWLRGYANARFARYTNTRFVRFMGVSAVALATSLILVGLCALWNVDPISAGLISQIGGAIVSYVLSRRAWERKGKPDLLRETIPFWIVFGIATVISTGATKLGYRVAVWSNLHGIDKVIVVEGIYLLANIATFLMRFVIFNYILFADRSKKGKGAPAGSVATGSVTDPPASVTQESVTQESATLEPVAQDSAA